MKKLRKCHLRGAILPVLLSALVCVAGCSVATKAPANSTSNSGSSGAPPSGSGNGNPPSSCGGGSLNGFVPFPANNLWNQDISGAQVDPNSNAIIGFIGAGIGLHPDFGSGL